MKLILKMIPLIYIILFSKSQRIKKEFITTPRKASMVGEEACL
jgi:hypothetical protein